MSTPGTRSVVTEHEATAAAALITEWRQAAGITVGQVTTAQLEQLRGMVMAALADARDGATLPGPRTVVEAHHDVHAMTWQTVAVAEDDAYRRVRRAWTDELHQQRLRPLEWPAVTRTFWRWRPSYTLGGEPMEQCEEREADLVRLSLYSVAVPA